MTTEERSAAIAYLINLYGSRESAIADGGGYDGDDDLVEMAVDCGYQSARMKEKNDECAKAISDAFAPYEVNGVLYSCLDKAGRVRAALVAEGIGNCYPGTREGMAALRKHGVISTPRVGERWGCGSQQGVIIKFTHDSRAVIRQDIHGGITPVGSEDTCPIHVLSPADIQAGGRYCS